MLTACAASLGMLPIPHPCQAREWGAPQGFFDAAIFNIQCYRASAAAFTIITGTAYEHVDGTVRSKLSLLAPHLPRAALTSREISGATNASVGEITGIVAAT